MFQSNRPFVAALLAYAVSGLVFRDTPTSAFGTKFNVHTEATLCKLRLKSISDKVKLGLMVDAPQEQYVFQISFRREERSDKMLALETKSKPCTRP